MRVFRFLAPLVAAAALLAAAAPAGAALPTTPTLAAKVYKQGGGQFTLTIYSSRRFRYPKGASLNRYADGWQPLGVRVTAGGRTVSAQRHGVAMPEFVFGFGGRGLPRGAGQTVVSFRTRKHGRFRLVAAAGRAGAAGAAASSEGPRALARACVDGNPARVLTEQERRELVSLVLCMVQRERKQRGRTVTPDASAMSAARGYLERAVATDAARFGSISAAMRHTAEASRTSLERVCAGRRWSSFATGNDSGPRGTLHTPVAVAKWVRDAERRRGTHLTLLSATRFAVVSRPGRFLEVRRAGARAVLILSMRCG